MSLRCLTSSISCQVPDTKIIKFLCKSVLYKRPYVDVIKVKDEFANDRT